MFALHFKRRSRETSEEQPVCFMPKKFIKIDFDNAILIANNKKRNTIFLI